MLSKHHVPAESFGLSLGKDDGLNCSLRESLEDRGDDSKLGIVSPPAAMAVEKGASSFGLEQERRRRKGGW